jgi:hypothetical protein
VAGQTPVKRNRFVQLAGGTKSINPTWAKLVRSFGVDRGECMADVFG